MWSNLLTGILAVACIALALAVSRTQSPPIPSSELHAQVPVAVAHVSADLAGDAEGSSAPAERVLDKELPEFRLDGVPLDAALETLAGVAKANLIVDWVAIEGADVRRDAPVRVHLYRVSVRGALIAIIGSLPHVGDGPVVYAEGDVIRISTSDFARPSDTTIIYDVTDMLNRLGNIPADELSDLLRQNIAPDSWQENGGRIGSTRALMGRLIVTQTPENQRKIAQYLRQLASGAQPVLPATQPTREDPKPLPAGGSR